LGHRRIEERSIVRNRELRSFWAQRRNPAAGQKQRRRRVVLWRNLVSAQEKRLNSEQRGDPALCGSSRLPRQHVAIVGLFLAHG
jgi:hypothetical protein